MKVHHQIDPFPSWFGSTIQVVKTSFQSCLGPPANVENMNAASDDECPHARAINIYGSSMRFGSGPHTGMSPGPELQFTGI